MLPLNGLVALVKAANVRNKHQNSCRLTHCPTGITAISQQRKRTQSFASAWAELERRVTEQATGERSAQISADRAQQMGSGMRADKIRTYRFQDDQVKDHNTGRSAKCSQIMKGRFDKLHR